MPTLIDSLPTISRAGRTPKYDYDSVFDGNAYVLTRGEDFEEDAKVENVKQNYRQAAKNRGLDITIRSPQVVEDRDNSFMLQVFEAEKEKEVTAPEAGAAE